MIRRLVARGLLSVMLAAALFSLFRMPAAAESVYQKITGMDGLTDGQYVMVTPGELALGALLETEYRITANVPVLVSDTVTAGAEWTLTVTEDGVTLMDAYGMFIAPVGDGSDGVAAGEYAWQVSLENGYFSFHGYSGEEPVTLVSDTIYDDGGFRACRDTDIEDYPDAYESRFTLYRYTEEQVEPEPSKPEESKPEESKPEPSEPEESKPEPSEPKPSEPEPSEPEPSEPAKTSPEVTVSPEGGAVAAGEEITLSCEDETAGIYFALSADGVNYQDWELYADPISFEKGFGTVYLRAYSAAGGCEPWEETEAVFT